MEQPNRASQMNKPAQSFERLQQAVRDITVVLGPQMGRGKGGRNDDDDDKYCYTDDEEKHKKTSRHAYFFRPVMSSPRSPHSGNPGTKSPG